MPLRRMCRSMGGSTLALPARPTTTTRSSELRFATKRETIMNLKLKSLLCVLYGAALILAGCDKPASSGGGGAIKNYPYKTVCTVGMVTDIVKQVAGDKAKVQGLLGEGVDPHLYKPTRDDVAAMMDADVVFYSGLMLEGKMADSLVKLGRDGKKVYAVTERIDEKYIMEPADMPGHADPHVWMDVGAWMKCVEAAAKALSELDPPNAAYYD